MKKFLVSILVAVSALVSGQIYNYGNNGIISNFQTNGIISPRIYYQIGDVDSSLIGLILDININTVNNIDSVIFNSTGVTVSSVNNEYVTVNDASSFVDGQSFRFGSGASGDVYTIHDITSNVITFNESVTANPPDELYLACLDRISDLSDSANHVTQTTTAYQPTPLWLGTDSATWYHRGTTNNYLSLTKAIGLDTVTISFRIKKKSDVNVNFLTNGGLAYNRIFTNAANRFYWETNTNNQYFIFNATTITTDSWYDISFVRESDTIRMYVDGNLIETVAVTDADVLYFNTIGVSSTSYHGEYSYIRVWSRALTTSEIQNYLWENNPYLALAENWIPIALGTYSGTSSDVSIADEILAGEYFKKWIIDTIESKPLPVDGKYFAMGWADFFPEDYNIILPLLNKYGHRSTFYFQQKPVSNNFSRTWNNTAYAKVIGYSDSYRGDHTFAHTVFPYEIPKADGYYFPSNDELRIDGGDGKNQFGADVNQTVYSFYGGIATNWLKLPPFIYNSTFADLTDGSCDTIRQQVAVFKMPKDASLGQTYLQVLDSLSERYCGTSGWSVKDDYTTRTPNNVSGTYPSESDTILGGIFQGGSTLQNHEIWERLLTIEDAYSKEFEENTNDRTYWATSGGITAKYHYLNGASRYYDKTYDTLADCASQFYSSINNEVRSIKDALYKAGIIGTMGAGTQAFRGSGYNIYGRHESQRIYKKNAFKSKPDNIGDGYTNSFRTWDWSIPIADQNTILANDSLVKELYDYTASNSRYAGSVYTSSSPPNFSDILKTMVKYIAWGTIPEGVGDSGTSVDSIKSSFALALEGIYNFCQNAGISIISHEQALQICYNDSLKNTNIFPNPTFDNTLRDLYPTSISMPYYPDGWNGGVVVDDTIGNTSIEAFEIDNQTESSITYFTRTYIVDFGDMDFSFYAKGTGTLTVKKIINTDLYDNDATNTFSTIITSEVNNTYYSKVSESYTVSNVSLLTYSSPVDEEEMSQQNYYNGWDNKICGFEITITVQPGDVLKLYNPQMIIS